MVNIPCLDAFVCSVVNILICAPSPVEHFIFPGRSGEELTQALGGKSEGFEQAPRDEQAHPTQSDVLPFAETRRNEILDCFQDGRKQGEGADDLGAGARASEERHEGEREERVGGNILQVAVMIHPRGNRIKPVWQPFDGVRGG